MLYEAYRYFYSIIINYAPVIRNSYDSVPSIVARSAISCVIAFIMSLGAGTVFIKVFSRVFASGIRPYLPQNHALKKHIPSMAGLYIIAIVITALMVIADWRQPAVWLVIMCLVGFGAIGAVDDYYKMVKYKKGISARTKFIAQCMVAGVIALLLYRFCLSTTVQFPFMDYAYDIGWLFVPWAMLVMISTSNAVNLTDGLDGLAISSLVCNFITFGCISFCVPWSYGVCMYVPELAVIAAALTGSCCGFWWYNRYPARVIMGDVGALSLGAALGLMALITKSELLLIITGAIFVAETLSVIVQVGSYTIFRKRFFNMAPLHHHFEINGLPESTITRRFFCVSLLLCALVLWLVFSTRTMYKHGQPNKKYCAQCVDHASSAAVRIDNAQSE